VSPDPVVLASLIVVAAVTVLRVDPAPPRRSDVSFDVSGAVTITAAVLVFAYGVVRLEYGTHGVITSEVFAAGLALLVAFVRVERRAASPLARLEILRSAPLVRTNLGALLFMALVRRISVLAHVASAGAARLDSPPDGAGDAGGGDRHSARADADSASGRQVRQRDG
jgi:hypothetical protein